MKWVLFLNHIGFYHGHVEPKGQKEFGGEESTDEDFND